MRTGLLVLLMLSLFVSCFAAEADKATEPARQETPATKTAPVPVKPAPVEKPAAKAAAAPTKAAAPAKPKRTTRTEVELSGITSETSDRIGARLNLSQTATSKSWWLRTDYNINKTRIYNNKGVTTNQIDTHILDGQYKVDGKDRYKFISATVNFKDWSPYNATYGDRSGYYMLSAGVGRSIMPGLDAEMAFGYVTRYDHGTDSHTTLVSTLRFKQGLTESMSLDADAKIIQPFSSETIVDSRTNLTYKLSPNVSLRLTYRANNLSAPVTASGWDKALSMSLVFSRTTY